MGNPINEKPFYTLEEYKAIEESSEERFEYLNGEIFSLAGASKGHNRIVSNTKSLLEKHYLEKGCEVYAETVKLLLKDEKQDHLYPDVMVSCESSDHNHNFVVEYPKILVEVSSKGTIIKDMNAKLDIYTKIPTLLYYLIIFTDAYKIRLYSKEGGKWNTELIEGIDSSVNLHLIDLNMSLKDIYFKFKNFWE